jgi:hypothetical protein
MSTSDIAEVERLVDKHAEASALLQLCRVTDPSIADKRHKFVLSRTALLDYVRGVIAERDEYREAATRLSAETYELAAELSAAPQPVGEVDSVDGIPTPTGHAEADRLIGRLMSSDPDFQDCADAARLIQREIKGPDGFATWRDAATAERIKRAQPVVVPCRVAQPTGWRCTRANGHEGPCAAVEDKT